MILSSMAECRTQLTRIQRSSAQTNPDISEQMKLIKEDVQQRLTKRAISRVDCSTFAYFSQISGIFDPLIALR